MSGRLLAVMGSFCLANCLLAAQTLQIQAVPSQGAIVGENFTLPLQATGGTPPYTWQLAGGELPPGCKLHTHAGNITCVPTTAGDYHFTLRVSDTSIPQLQAQQELTIHVIAGLSIEWKEPPNVHGSTISGSLIVNNQTPEEFGLTVIVVAVNEIGRATTLGYQHVKLPAQATTQEIPFSASPGPGTYYVRADAVAHRSGHHHVYRASKQTPATISVGQL